MSDIKEELNYYKADEFLDKYMKGEMNIHHSIQLKNRTQTTINLLRNLIKGIIELINPEYTLMLYL